jgi:hypothetical protein
MTQQEFDQLVALDIQRLVAKAQAEYKPNDEPDAAIEAQEPIDPNKWAFDNGLESF